MPSEQIHNSVLHYHIKGGSVVEWFKGLDLENYYWIQFYSLQGMGDGTS